MKTIAQLLEIKEFTFVLENKIENGKIIYKEFIDNSWIKYEYDENNNLIYFETSAGFWLKKNTI